jgi:uncharacterized tellurite resistance protein B-like protein
LSPKPAFWSRFSSVFESSTAPADPQEAVRLGAAVLLVEMARADNEHALLEREKLGGLLRGHFGLDEPAAAELVAAAEGSADADISMHRHLDALNTHLDHSQKQAVMRLLWQIAYADDTLHRHEEHLLRRMADLLHLSHGDFIRAKLAVQSKEQGG